MAIFDMKNSSQHPTQTIWSLYSIILTEVITLYQQNIEVAHHFPSSEFSLSSTEMEKISAQIFLPLQLRILKLWENKSAHIEGCKNKQIDLILAHLSIWLKAIFHPYLTFSKHRSDKCYMTGHDWMRGNSLQIEMSNCLSSNQKHP